MRIIGIDFGQRRIGIAVSDELGMFATGVESYTCRSEEEDFRHLTEVIAQYKAGKIVVGLPLNMNGTRGPQAEKYSAMGLKLQEITGVKVEFIDERLTTSAANRVLISADVSRKKRKQVVDTMAAQLILQNYLDRH